jgi:NAD-dependent SIR2 family protein deacetylase
MLCRDGMLEVNETRPSAEGHRASETKEGLSVVKAFEDVWERRGTLHYRLCPRCQRAVPTNSSERYCINDGSWLLERCPLCSTTITNPYARFCAACGLEFAGANSTEDAMSSTVSDSKEENR